MYHVPCTVYCERIHRVRVILQQSAIMTCTLCPDWKEVGSSHCTTTDIVRATCGFSQLSRLKRRCPRDRCKGFSREYQSSPRLKRVWGGEQWLLDVVAQQQTLSAARNCCDFVRRAQLLWLGFSQSLRLNRRCPHEGFSCELCVAICIVIVVIDGVCNVMIQQKGLQRGSDWKTADQRNDASPSAAAVSSASAAAAAVSAARSALDDI